MRLYLLLIAMLMFSCTLEKTEQQIPQFQEPRLEDVSEDISADEEVYVVDTPERPVTLDDLPGEFQAAAGVSWCPEGDVRDVQGIAHIYHGIVTVQIHGNKVEACEVEGSLDGERLFYGYFTQDESLSRTVMYFGDTEDGSSERWKEGALMCEQQFDPSGSPLGNPDCS